MPAPFPPSDTALVRFRLTQAVPAGPPAPNPLGPSFPNVPSSPARPVGYEDTEVFDLNPPTGDIAEVEKQWKIANPPESGKEWQDAVFPGPARQPVTPLPVPQPPDVDAQGLRHRATGEEETRSTVTEGIPVPGRGVGFEEGEDHAEQPTFGDESLTLAQLEGQSDEQILSHPGIGEITLAKIRKAQKSRAAG
jgi:hypothetical protein